LVKPAWALQNIVDRRGVNPQPLMRMTLGMELLMDTTLN